jgi:hypothetical protein
MMESFWIGIAAAGWIVALGQWYSARMFRKLLKDSEYLQNQLLSQINRQNDIAQKLSKWQQDENDLLERLISALVRMETR